MNISQLPPLKPSLFIYRNSLLPSSETFILAQGESLSDFRSIYVGLRRVPGLDMPQDRCVLLAAGRFPRLKSAQLKLSGASASDVTRLRAFRPNLVHAHFGMDAVNAMTLAKALDIPLVVTFHGWDATVRDEILRCQSIALNLYIKRRPRLGRVASRVLCVSEFIRQQVLKKGFSPSKTIVHYTGIDLTRFTPDPSLERQPIVLFVGRLVEKKGCEYVIRAMQQVQSIVKGAQLVIIGDGVLRKSLELQAQSTLRSCRFLGACSAEVIRQWMNRASVFSTPSIVADSGDAEGFGMVFAEAQAMGLPVASFATGGVPEAVEHGVTGLLAPERNTNALANNIVTLLTDTCVWRSFSAAGQERVKNLFDLEKQSPKLEQIYQEVLRKQTEQRRSTIAVT
jgi:colanic acid/amylovoran biosynthesis glycosyltransferase